MPFEEKTFYRAICDGCNRAAEDYGGATHWEDQDQALMMAEQDDGWAKQDDGRILCWECRLAPGGDYYEEDEE